jgi:hypothetical protein
LDGRRNGSQHLMALPIRFCRSWTSWGALPKMTGSSLYVTRASCSWITLLQVG